MADSVEFDESAVRKCVVDGASTLAEEVWPVRARHYEDGRVYVEIIRKLVLFDGTIHLDDLFGEFHTVRPDRPFRQPRVKVVDSIRVEDLLNVAFHSLSALTVLDESRHSVGKVSLLAELVGGNRWFVRDDRLDRCIRRRLDCRERAIGVAEQDRLAVNGVSKRAYWVSRSSTSSALVSFRSSRHVPNPGRCGTTAAYSPKCGRTGFQYCRGAIPPWRNISG